MILLDEKNTETDLGALDGVFSILGFWNHRRCLLDVARLANPHLLKHQWTMW